MANRLTRKVVHDLLDRHGLGPSRALGQNFLCDGQMVDKIVRLSGVTEGDHVLEIGPGLGSLTVGLLDAGATVCAIEIDKYLVPALEETIGQHQSSDKFTLYNKDVREVDWEPILGDFAWSVVANLPYNIATPLILDFLADRPECMNFLVMVQREAGERLVAEPGSKTYGIPSVLASYWATGRIVGSVKAELFYPKPKVESVLVELTRRPDTIPDCDFKDLQNVVKAGFGQRRKMIRRSLAALVTPTEIESADIAPTQRAEQLDLTQWVALAQLAGNKQDNG